MTVSTRSRLRTVRDALTPAEWGRFSVMGLVILALNVLGWGIFVFAIPPHHFSYAGLGLGIGGDEAECGARPSQDPGGQRGHR